MILCVTLNPCLDKTLTVPSWRPGELVRGTRVREVVGGKGNNVARALKRHDLDFEEVRVAQRRRNRVEIEDLTGQTWVPVLVDGEEVIHDSHRILEYVGSTYG